MENHNLYHYLYLKFIQILWNFNSKYNGIVFLLRHGLYLAVCNNRQINMKLAGTDICIILKLEVVCYLMLYSYFRC